MEVVDLNLFNFRNFSKKTINFDKNLTVIIGPNGSGKSNILEAIGFLSGLRSSRIETDLDLVKFGKSEAKIESKVESSGEKRNLIINFLVVDELYVKKTYFVDSLKKRLLDLSQFVSIVIFSPQDLELVTGSPSLRRHHLDLLLSSLDRDYWRNFNAYNKIIVRRNKVLVRILEGKSKPQELDFWDSRILEHGNFISKRREEFFEFLNTSASSVQVEGLKGSRTKSAIRASGFSWQLKQSLLTAEKLLKNRQRDIAAGVTLSGPHRDDFEFCQVGKNLEYFGSRGEQ